MRYDFLHNVAMTCIFVTILVLVFIFISVLIAGVNSNESEVRGEIIHLSSESYTLVCIEGVQYYVQYPYGYGRMAVSYNRDGTIKLCEEEEIE